MTDLAPPWSFRPRLHWQSPVARIIDQRSSWVSSFVASSSTTIRGQAAAGLVESCLHTLSSPVLHSPPLAHVRCYALISAFCGRREALKKFSIRHTDWVRCYTRWIHSSPEKVAQQPPAIPIPSPLSRSVSRICKTATQRRAARRLISAT